VAPILVPESGTSFRARDWKDHPKDIALTLAKPGGRVPFGRTTWENWFHFLTPKLVPFSGTETGAAF